MVRIKYFLVALLCTTAAFAVLRLMGCIALSDRGSIISYAIAILLWSVILVRHTKFVGREESKENG